MAGDIHRSLNLNVPNRTTRRILSGAPSLNFKKVKRYPSLTSEHKTNRLRWAPVHASVRPQNWASVVLWNLESLKWAGQTDSSHNGMIFKGKRCHFLENTDKKRIHEGVGSVLGID